MDLVESYNAYNLHNSKEYQSVTHTDNDIMLHEDEYFDAEFDISNDPKASNWSEDDIDIENVPDYSELCIFRQSSDSSYISNQQKVYLDRMQSQTPSHTQYWSCSQCNELNS